MAEISTGGCLTCDHERAIVDTTLPFRSVKDAVSLFGERVNRKKVSKPEGPLEDELHHLRQDLSGMKGQLRDTENAKRNALLELEIVKKQLQDVTKTFSTVESEYLGDGLNSSNSNVGKLVPKNLINNKQKHAVWEKMFDSGQVQQTSVILELEMANKELQKLQQELAISLIEKENAVRQAEEALQSAEINAKRVEELTNEMSGTNESLVLVKLACLEANKERAALLVAKNADVGISETLGIEAIGALKLKLSKAAEDLTILQKELVATRHREEKALKSATEAQLNIEHVRAALQDMQSKASATDASCKALSQELEIATGELANALKNGSYLKTLLADLQSEAETMKVELEGARQREANTQAAISNLNMDLARKKAELEYAVACEAKTKEACLELSQTLQQITAEADIAKESAKTFKEELCKARADAEQCRAAKDAAEQELQATLKVVESAKATESNAQERLRQVLEDLDDARASEVEGGTHITITSKEHYALKNKCHDVEELAIIRVEAANAHKVAVKAWESEIHQKLGSLNEDINEMKNATTQAFNRAKLAEAAKSAVENEVRRWREKELQRREKEAIAKVQKDYLAMGLLCSNSQPLPFGHHSESLAQMLNMKIPSSLEKENSRVDWALTHDSNKKKKKHILPSLSTMLGKKNQTRVV